MRILIADDHPIFRSGVKDILESNITGCEVIAVENGKDATSELENGTFAVAILDVDMPGLSGLEVARQLHEEESSTRVIILTMFKDDEIFHKALDCGVSGFLLKEHSGKEVVRCIDRILLGEEYFGRGLEEKLQNHSKWKRSKTELEEKLALLTQAERKTLKLVSQNLTSKDIASRLFVTPKTVENYRSRICKKLMLEPGNNSLIRWAMENKESLQEL